MQKTPHLRNHRTGSLDCASRSQRSALLENSKTPPSQLYFLSLCSLIDSAYLLPCVYSVNTQVHEYNSQWSYSASLSVHRNSLLLFEVIPSPSSFLCNLDSCLVVLVIWLHSLGFNQAMSEGKSQINGYFFVYFSSCSDLQHRVVQRRRV